MALVEMESMSLLKYFFERINRLRLTSQVDLKCTGIETTLFFHNLPLRSILVFQAFGSKQTLTYAAEP
ncbi:MAG: hypothetical protein ACLFWL_19195 [Candidatus Brocadiia bacterium]